MCYWLVGGKWKGILKGLIRTEEGDYLVDVYEIKENKLIYAGSTRLKKSNIGKKLTHSEKFFIAL